MKKQYEQPMAEKIEFNYRETIVASDTPVPTDVKKGKNNPGCYGGNAAYDRGCELH